MNFNRIHAIATTARFRLGQEAARADHDLRLLVGHASLLDSLMSELDDHGQEPPVLNEYCMRAPDGYTRTMTQHEDAQDTMPPIEEDLEEISDDEDDEDHALYAMSSGRNPTRMPGNAQQPDPADTTGSLSSVAVQFQLVEELHSAWLIAATIKRSRRGP